MKRKQPQREDSTPNTKLDADIMVDKQLFTDADYQKLMVVALGETGATREQVYWFIQQCERMKVQALLLETLLSGMVNVSNISEDSFLISRRSAPLRFRGKPQPWKTVVPCRLPALLLSCLAPYA